MFYPVVTYFKNTRVSPGLLATRYLGAFLHVLRVEERVVNSEHYPVKQGAVQRFSHGVSHGHSLKEKRKRWLETIPVLHWKGFCFSSAHIQRSYFSLAKAFVYCFILRHVLTPSGVGCNPRAMRCAPWLGFLLCIQADDAWDHTINPITGGERKRNKNLYKNKIYIKNMYLTSPRSLKSLFGEKEQEEWMLHSNDSKWCESTCWGRQRLVPAEGLQRGRPKPLQ